MQNRTAAANFGVLVLLLAGCSTSPEPPVASMTSMTSMTSTSPSTSAGPIRGPQQPVVTPLVGSVLAVPVPVPATDGRVHLAYEVRLTNVLAQEVTLTSMVVLDRDVSLLTLAGEQLVARTRVLGTSTPTTKIGPAQSAVIWMDVALDKGAGVPDLLVHAVGLSLPEPNPPLFPATMIIDIAPTEVQSRKPIVISPPLSGPDWLNGDGCCSTSAHRLALNPIDGQLWAAERYAIDYVQLRPALDSRITDPSADTLLTGEPAQMEPGFAARDDNELMPMKLDVMTYADR